MSDEAKIKRVREMRDFARRNGLIHIDVLTVDLTAIVDENDRLRARVAELEEQVKEAVVRLARVPNMLDRERREGAEAMRERVANVARSFGFDVVADEIRALPLDDDAREDAQGDDNGR